MAKRPTRRNKVKTKTKPKGGGKSRGSKSGGGTSRNTKVKAAKAKSGRTVMVIVPQTITLSLPPVLHDRLKGLSQVMGLSMEGVLRQALTEFADTWEEHHRTVAALAEGSDRVQLAVKD